MRKELIPDSSFAGSMSHCSWKSVCISTVSRFTENLIIGRLLGPVQIKIEANICRKLLKMKFTSLFECPGAFGQNLWCLLPPSLVLTIGLRGSFEDPQIGGEIWSYVQISTILVALLGWMMTWIWWKLSSTVNLSAIWHKFCFWQDIKYADWSKNVTPFWPAVVASALSFRGLINLATSGNWLS